MKRILFLFVLIISALGFVFSACEESKVGGEENIENEIEAPENEIPEELQLGEIRMKAFPDENKKISFQILAKKISVDWGDGNVEELVSDNEMVAVLIPSITGYNRVTLFSDYKTVSHEYSNNNLQKIRIFAEDIICIGNSAYIEMSGTFKEIQFGECPLLYAISFPNIGLAELEFEKMESLEFLDCSNNNLSASALNNLFGALPEKSGWILYDKNEGSETCDKKIAEKKGWYDELKVQESPLELYIVASRASFARFLRIHYQFEGLFSNVINIEDFPMYNFSGPYYDAYYHYISSSNYFVQSLYVESYRTLRELNASLTRFKESDEGDMSLFIHSFSVMRAYTYFIMVNYWGKITVIDERFDINLSMNPERVAIELVLSSMIEDLLEAEKHLPADEHKSDFGFSKSFAQLMLAKVYAYQGNYSKALEYTNKIINSERFSLLSSQGEIFETQANKELIAKFADTYHIEGGDEFLRLMISKGTYMPFARYPEVLLLASESYLKNNDIQSAANLLNIVRKRNNRPEVRANNPDDIENAILDEYEKDLGKEGLFFFALKRFGKAESVLGLEAYEKLLPIPASEIYLTPKISQNEGY